MKSDNRHLAVAGPIDQAVRSGGSVYSGWFFLPTTVHHGFWWLRNRP